MSITLLTAEQSLGDNALGALKDYGEKQTATDLAVLLGIYLSVAKEKQCFAYTTTPRGSKKVAVFGLYGGDTWQLCRDDPIGDDSGIRPVLPASEVKKMTTFSGRGGAFMPTTMEYGEYPQDLAPQDISQQLETALQNHSLPMTGKKYTFDRFKHEKNRTENDPFSPLECPEYIYNEKKYIRVISNTKADPSQVHGNSIKRGEPCWVEVQPIQWLEDKETGMWISEKVLLAGIPFDTKSDYNGDFKSTSMYKYLQNYFANDIQPSKYSQVYIDQLVDEINQENNSLIRRFFKKKEKPEEILQKDLKKRLAAKKPNRLRLRQHKTALQQQINKLQAQKEIDLQTLTVSDIDSPRYKRAKLVKKQHKEYGSKAAIEMNKYLKKQDNLGADERKEKRKELSSIGANIQKSKAQQKSIIDKLTASTRARQTRAGEILKARAEVVRRRRAVEEAQKAVDAAKAEYKAFIRKTLKDNVK